VKGEELDAGGEKSLLGLKTMTPYLKLAADSHQADPYNESGLLYLPHTPPASCGCHLVKPVHYKEVQGQVKRGALRSVTCATVTSRNSH